MALQAKWQFMDRSVTHKIVYGPQLCFGPYNILWVTSRFINYHMALSAMNYLLNIYIDTHYRSGWCLLQFSKVFLVNFQFHNVIFVVKFWMYIVFMNNKILFLKLKFTSFARKRWLKIINGKLLEIWCSVG